MKKIFAVLVVLGFVFIAIVPYRNLLNYSLPQERIIEVEDGETFYSLPNKLGLDEAYFKIYLKLHPPEFTLQKGSYLIGSGVLLPEIIESLKKPLPEDKQVTILEGWNIYDIDDYLTSSGLIEKGEFISQAEGESFYKYKYDFSVIADASTLEGYLYPDTYNINPSEFSVDTLIKAMLTNFETKVAGKTGDAYGAMELLDIITMASIVEKEEKNPKEKPIVAGILKKRIQEGWMVGADATVCYPYKLTHKDCTPAFIGAHIDDKNQYNTRTMLGTPMTPISNPSYETIDAVIHSEDSPYYFYLHDDEGGIHYATTNEEHIANKNKYIQ